LDEADARSRAAVTAGGYLYNIGFDSRTVVVGPVADGEELERAGIVEPRARAADAHRC